MAKPKKPYAHARADEQADEAHNKQFAPVTKSPKPAEKAEFEFALLFLASCYFFSAEPATATLLLTWPLLHSP